MIDYLIVIDVVKWYILEILWMNYSVTNEISLHKSPHLFISSRILSIAGSLVCILVPSFNMCGTPPNNWRAIANFILSNPYIVGAIEKTSLSYIIGSFANFLIYKIVVSKKGFNLLHYNWKQKLSLIMSNVFSKIKR